MGNNAIDQYIEVILGKVCSVCPHNAQCEKGLTCDKNKDYQKMIIAGAEWQLQHLGHPDPPGEQGADGTTIIKEVMKEKAIEAFNEAMTFYTSAACPSEEEALKHFIACLDQEQISGCSEKPNDLICGNCDSFCECIMGPYGVDCYDPACPMFDDSTLSQTNEKDHEAK